MPMRTTLVIGGTRNLGPELVAALLARGDRVTVLNRGITADDLPVSVERLRADRGDASALGAALRGRQFDVVVDTTLYTAAEAETAVRLLDGNVGRYIAWSTGNVYLVREGLTRPFREADYDGPVMAEPPRDREVDHRNWVYGVGKRDAEDVLRSARARTGFPYVSLRMPMINSARDHYRRLANYLLRILDGAPLLLPEDELPVRHVYGPDVIAATLLAAEPQVPAGAAVNVSQDETLTLEEMLQLIADAAGRPLTVRRVPRTLLEQHQLLPACSPYSDPWMSALDNARSKAALGLHYTSATHSVHVLVAAQRHLTPAEVPGYTQRPNELELVKG